MNRRPLLSYLPFNVLVAACVVESLATDGIIVRNHLNADGTTTCAVVYHLNVLSEDFPDAEAALRWAIESSEKMQELA